MLTINPSEVILTIINFFLLFFLLRRFLYNPIIKYMDERKKGIEEKMELERKALATLDELEKSMDMQRRQTMTRAREIIAQARADVEERGKLLMQQGREQSALNRKKAAVSAAMVSEREKQRVHSHIDRLAKVLADSLLGAKAS